MHLADAIGRWIGKVEIVLAGAEDDLRDGEEALAAGDGVRARAAARRVLARAPDSPIGLALLADACEAAGLDAELALTLEELARRAPSRAEVWVRLARARQATGASAEEASDALLRALAVAEAGSRARVDALTALADVDLGQANGARAELWLARVVGDDPEIVVRRAEARLLQGDPLRAKALLQPVPWSPTDGRAALALGRALAGLGDAAAFGLLLRALVLDVPGASEALSDALARLPSDPQTRTRVRSIVDAKGEQSLARWRAAFGQAEGAREAARHALREALREGETGVARPLLDAALEDRDRAALAEALGPLAAEVDPAVADAHRLLAALSIDPTRTADALDMLAAVSNPRATAWATEIARTAAAGWVPTTGEPAQWGPLLARLDAHAHTLRATEAAAGLSQLATDRSSPVVLAVVGEFNAGKSTFINALIGADVAPTGILPTTAALHHLRWAPDPFAKIMLAPPLEPSERFVAPADLRATLGQLDPASVRRVEIRMPLPALARVEVLDTPGFNADVAAHGTIARSALDEADILVWLVDATQAIKQTEKRVLEEAVRLELPVQVLVNKADRLTPDETRRVMDDVVAGLASIGVSSWRPPCAFSSKKALAGRLGDAEALRDSGWETVQALFDEGLVGQSDALKELALRRRAARLVDRLVAACQARVEDDASRAQAARDVARTSAEAAARIEQNADAIATELEGALGPAAERWARDLAPVFVGRDPAAAARDPILSRYRVDRALAVVAPDLARELVALAAKQGPVAVGPEELTAVVRAVVRTAASGGPALGAGDRTSVLPLICRASIAALVEQLFARSAMATAPTDAAWSGTLRELEAFAAALE